MLRTERSMVVATACRPDSYTVIDQEYVCQYALVPLDFSRILARINANLAPIFRRGSARTFPPLCLVDSDSIERSESDGAGSSTSVAVFVDQTYRREKPAHSPYLLAHSALSPRTIMINAGKRLALDRGIWFHPFDDFTESDSPPLWMSTKSRLKNHPHKASLRPLLLTHPGLPNPSSSPASQLPEVSLLG